MDLTSFLLSFLNMFTKLITASLPKRQPLCYVEAQVKLDLLIFTPELMIDCLPSSCVIQVLRHRVNPFALWGTESLFSVLYMEGYHVLTRDFDIVTDGYRMDRMDAKDFVTK